MDECCECNGNGDECQAFVSKKETTRSPDGAERNPGLPCRVDAAPDFAPLHPGYEWLPADDVAEQARQVDEASGNKGDDQHRIHRKTPKIGGRRQSPDDSREKIERDSGRESQGLFFAGFISCLRNAARFSGAGCADCAALRSGKAARFLPPRQPIIAGEPAYAA
jgi:hypothetical protein